MPKNVMKLMKPVAHNGANGFDLSHRHLYGMNFGELLPSTFIETVPGDYIQLHASDLLRAIPLVTSPFMRVKQHLDVWFVSYQDLWSKFPDFMVRKNQPKHAISLNFQYAPYANLKDIQDAISHNSESDPIASRKDVVGRGILYGSKKLFDLCGYGEWKNYGATTAPAVNLWRIAAYNKIWYENYRQQYYDNGMRLFVSDEGEQIDEIKAAALWNFDDVNCISASAADISMSDYVDFRGRIQAMFQMRYRCWKKDLLTGVMPSTQFGAVSSVGFNDVSLLDKFVIHNTKVSGATDKIAATDGDSNLRLVDGTLGTLVSKSDKWNLQDSDGYDYKVLASQNSTSLGFDILELRHAEALQIWRENALRAGNRVSDNLRAHYGEDAEYNDHNCVLLGSIDAPLNIGDIDAQAQTGSTGNSVLGSIAGKGTSTFNDKVFKFKAKEFGVIVAIHSLLPEAEYESLGVDRMNQLLEYEDYFVPEYENIGLEAVSNHNFVTQAVETASVLGYAPRYYGYKQKLDKVFNAFHADGGFAHWASPKTDVTDWFSDSHDSSAAPLSVLYVNPALFNNNFVVDIDNSDQILCDIYFDVQAVRRMSVVGLPNS